MMEVVRSWLLSVIAAAVLCSLAEALMPSGAVKRVGRLVCGLVLLYVVLSPVARLDLEGGQRWLEDYAAFLDQRKTELKGQTEERMKVIIEEQYAAYIVDKAREMEADCTARVGCREEEGVFLPDTVRVAGVLNGQVRGDLARLISQDLGVPLERQAYVDEEGEP